MQITIKNIAFVAAAALLLAGCDVKDSIYDTTHPDHGKITLTTVWDNTNLTSAPKAGYTVAVGDYSATVTSNAAMVDHLFQPGSYTGYVYTAADKIAVSGSGVNTVATVAAATAPSGAGGAFVASDPAFLYSGKQTVTIEKDKEYEITVPMRQQVRELKLIIRPSGDAVGKVIDVTATLGGVSGAWNLHTDMPQGDPVSVVSAFAKNAAGDWEATVRLLGLTGAAQVLEGRITFSDGLDAIPFNKPLHEMAAFAAFNADKKTPLALEAQVVEVHGRLALGDFSEIPGWTGSEEDIQGYRIISSEEDLRLFSAAWKNTYVAGDKEATWAAQYEVLKTWSGDAEYMPGSGIPPKGTVRLGCDLDMSADGDNSPFDPIGHIMAHPFNATFDGDGHKISNLTIIGQGTAATGLFGYVTGEIKNLHIASGTITGGDQYLGAIAGYLTILNPGENTNPNAATGIGKITDCSNAATVTGAGNTGGIAGYLSHLSVVSGCDNTGEIIGADNIGGIAGYNSSSTITDCTNSGDITSTGAYVGGLCGIANSGLVQRSHNTGKVSASGNYVGGISGNLLTAGKIIYCSNTGNVKGGQYVGGLTGQVGATATNAYVVSSFNKGDVEATGSYAGGVVGYMRRTVTACYNTGTVKGARYVGGVCGYVYAIAPDPDRNIQGTIVRACYSTGQIICTDSSVGGIAGFSQGNSGSRTVVIQTCYWVDDFANARPSTIRPGTLKFGLAEADVSGWPASTDLGWGTGGAAGSHPYADNYWKVPLQGYNTEGYYPKLSWED